jgi:ubiquinone biosynthesis monooxygenase Coq7
MTSNNRGPSVTPRARTVAVPPSMWPALRSDHAGETGAVFIYRGILRVSRNTEVRRFARQHLETELAHLALMQQLVPPRHRSRLLGVWRIAGWFTGAVPAVFGASAVFRTIEAVETFVDYHYAAQTRALAGDRDHAELRDLLEGCRLDEVEHRDDAGRRLGDPGLLGRLWCLLVGQGSRIGVALASRV